MYFFRPNETFHCPTHSQMTPRRLMKVMVCSLLTTAAPGSPLALRTTKPNDVLRPIARQLILRQRTLHVRVILLQPREKVQANHFVAFHYDESTLFHILRICRPPKRNRGARLSVVCQLGHEPSSDKTAILTSPDGPLRRVDQSLPQKSFLPALAILGNSSLRFPLLLLLYLRFRRKCARIPFEADNYARSEQGLFRCRILHSQK